MCMNTMYCLNLHMQALSLSKEYNLPCESLRMISKRQNSVQWTLWNNQVQKLICQPKGFKIQLATNLIPWESILIFDFSKTVLSSLIFFCLGKAHANASQLILKNSILKKVAGVCWEPGTTNKSIKSIISSATMDRKSGTAPEVYQPLYWMNSSMHST